MADYQTSREMSVREGYALWSTLYDQENNGLIALEELQTERLLQQIPYKNVLDVGAGTGRYALKCARKGARVTAIDQSSEMLAVAQQTAHREGLPIDFHLAPFEDGLPFSAKQFDLVICALMLCHVPALSRSVQELSRVLQPGGFLLITDFHPDCVHSGWRTEFRQEGVRYLLPNMPHTRADYLAALTSNGLTIQTTIEQPVGNLPAGYASEAFINEHREKLFSLILLAQK
jgi:malonyl-CoA O-methyltransferase